MSRSATSLAVASLAAGSLIMLGSATASAQTQDHTDVALNFVATAIVNEWGSPCVIDWTVSPPTGTSKGACFFNLVLKRARGYQNRDLLAMWGSTSPGSTEYFDIIDSSPLVGASAPVPETHFRKLARATQIQKGDIIAIGATDVYSGHLAIVTGPAVDITSARIMPNYSGTKQYAVPIVDSSNTSHGCNASYPDSRWRGPCTGGYMDPGAGTAYMRFYTDSLSGALLGFTWSVTSSTTSYYSPSTRPYRIGRLFKLPAPIQDPVDPPPPP
jgi:hypothetical protein